MSMGETIRELLNQKPFRPFRVQMIGERSAFRVTSAEGASVDENGEVLELQEPYGQVILNVVAIEHVVVPP
jgi:hypothetical protein